MNPLCLSRRLVGIKRSMLTFCLGLLLGGCATRPTGPVTPGGQISFPNFTNAIQNSAVTAPCDPRYPVYVPVQAGAVVTCTSAISEQPSDPGRAYVSCFPNCGGPWTIYPGASQAVTGSGTLYILGNGTGGLNTCAATVTISGPVGTHPQPGPYIPGNIQGKTLQATVGKPVDQPLAVAYMCHGHDFVPNITLLHWGSGWESGWYGAPVGNGLPIYGYHIYTAAGTYRIRIIIKVYCPHGENSGEDLARADTTVVVTP